jgi:hypothetical protein
MDRAGEAQFMPTRIGINTDVTINDTRPTT